LNAQQVDVLLPCGPNVRYLEEAVTSILDQSGVRVRVILVDDTRNQQSQQKLIELSRGSPAIFYVENSGIGLVDALNTGLAHVETEFCARMDADDIALHGRLRRQIEILQAHQNTVLVSGLVRYIDESGLLLPGINWVERGIPVDKAEIRSRLKKENCIFHPTVMFRTAAVRSVGGYTNNYPHIEDYDLWLRLLHIGDFETLEFPVLLYRIHPTQIGAVHGSEQEIENAVIQRQFDFSTLDNRRYSTPHQNLDIRQVEYCAVLTLNDEQDLPSFLSQLCDIPHAELRSLLILATNADIISSQTQIALHVSQTGLNVDLTIAHLSESADNLNNYWGSVPPELPVCFFHSLDKVIPTRVYEQCSEIANRSDAWVLGQISTDGTVNSAIYPSAYFSYPSNVSLAFSDLHLRSNVTCATGALANFYFDAAELAPSLIQQVVGHLQDYELREIPTHVGNLYAPRNKRFPIAAIGEWLSNSRAQLRSRISNLRSRISNL